GRGGQLGEPLYTRQVGLSLLGRREGGYSHSRQEQGAAQNGDDHSHQPYASGAASGEVGAQGERAENREDEAENTAEDVGEHIVFGGDIARPGLVVSIRVGLRIEA